MMKLPIGLQSFKQLREDGYLYVDKTEQVYDLVNGGKYIFLSRPRRFGKSLLVNTIKEVFLGNKAVFDGLWIVKKMDWEEHPIIHISFNDIGYQGLGLEEAIVHELNQIAKRYQIELEMSDIGLAFKELIQKLSRRNKVVILIDEYDKPLVDYLSDSVTVDKHIQILRRFYSIIKSADEYIRFFFITGVSKFNKISVFSDLNNLHDISLHPRYVALVGFTQKEMIACFSERIQQYADANNTTFEITRQEIKSWYDGYSWDGNTFVYNPFSLMCFFEQMMFRGFWFLTGTPSFLIDLVRSQGIAPDLIERKTVTDLFLEKFTVDSFDFIAILFQTGYLTIKSIKERRGRLLFDLAYPNNEVRNAFLHSLAEAYTYKPSSEVSEILIQMEDALVERDVEQFMKFLKSLFAEISYHLQPKNHPNKTEADLFAAWEGYFQAIIYVVLKFIGLFARTEVTTNKGRMDVLLELENCIYIMEFKLDESASKAIQQIKDKGYADPYLAKGKDVILLGVSFDSSIKNVKDWKMESL